MYLTHVFDSSGQRYSLDSEKIGDLSRLQTEAKGTLTAAVNEVDGRVPKAEAADEGAFLRVADGVLAFQQLTDVSEVGA